MLCLCQLIFLFLRVYIKLVISRDYFNSWWNECRFLLCIETQQCSNHLKLWICLLWKKAIRSQSTPYLTYKYQNYKKSCINQCKYIPKAYICSDAQYVMYNNTIFNSLARFVFIIGTSVVLAFTSMHRKGVPWLQLLRKVTWRTIVLMLIGFCFMNYSPRDGYCE